MDVQAGADQTGPVSGSSDAQAEPVADAEPEPQLAAAKASTPETGEPRVDAALRLLDDLPGLPVSEHAALFERVHAELAGVLGELDPESAGAGG